MDDANAGGGKGSYIIGAQGQVLAAPLGGTAASTTYTAKLTGARKVLVYLPFLTWQKMLVWANAVTTEIGGILTLDYNPEKHYIIVRDALLVAQDMRAGTVELNELAVLQHLKDNDLWAKEEVHWGLWHTHGPNGNLFWSAIDETEYIDPWTTRGMFLSVELNGKGGRTAADIIHRVDTRIGVDATKRDTMMQVTIPSEMFIGPTFTEEVRATLIAEAKAADSFRRPFAAGQGTALSALPSYGGEWSGYTADGDDGTATDNARSLVGVGTRAYGHDKFMENVIAEHIANIVHDATLGETLVSHRENATGEVNILRSGRARVNTGKGFWTAALTPELLRQIHKDFYAGQNVEFASVLRQLPHRKVERAREGA